MTSKNILFVFNKLSNDQGGLTTATLPIINHLVTQKHITAQIICHQYDTQYIEQYLSQDIIIQSFPGQFIPSYSISFSAKKWLEERIDTFDFIHIHGIYYYLSDMTQHFAIKTQTPFMISFHGMLNNYALTHKLWKKKLYHWLSASKKKYAKATYLQALSKGEKHDIKTFLGDYLSKSNLIDIPNGVNEAIFKPLNSKVDKNNALQLLFAGRIDSVKQYKLVIEAFIKFNAINGKKHRLILAGFADKDNMQLLDQIISNNRDHHIEYMGMLEQPSLVALMQSSDLFINASKSEASSMSVLEAMACGCACIIANNASFSVNEHEAMRLLEHPVTVDCIVQAIDELANNDIYRFDISNKAVKCVEQKYTTHKVAKSLLNLYHFNKS